MPRPDPIPVISRAHAERMSELGHAIQSGVKFDQEMGSQDGSPKHLRVGLNIRATETAALSRLLLAKGIVTQEELGEAFIEALEQEVARYETLLSAKFGKEVELK